MKIYNFLPFAIKYLYWQYLKLDAETCAEMPQVKEYRRRKAEKYNPFKI